MKEDEVQFFESYGMLDELKNVSRKYYGKTDSCVALRGVGCAKCYMTGYYGRLAIQEVLVIDDTLRAMIARQRPLDELRQHINNQNFKTLMMDGLQKVMQGFTTLDELLKVIVDE
jgi:type IV pilus assembly protein PilB